MKIKSKKTQWKTIFDAYQDNEGNGIPIEELLLELNKVRKE